MIVFQTASKNNLYKALNEHVWQCNKENPRQLKIGDVAFIKMNGENEIHFLGVVQKISQEDLMSWPDPQPGSRTKDVATIRMKEAELSDFKLRQGCFSYDKYSE